MKHFETFDDFLEATENLLFTEKVRELVGEMTAFGKGGACYARMEKLVETEKENEGLRKKLDQGTEQHLADTKKLDEYYTKMKGELLKLNDDLAKQVAELKARPKRAWWANHDLKQAHRDLLSSLRKTLSEAGYEECECEGDGMSKDCEEIGDSPEWLAEQIHNLVTTRGGWEQWLPEGAQVQMLSTDLVKIDWASSSDDD